MNYQKIYMQIVNKYKVLNLQKHQGIYLESHHIIPRCIGGNNDNNNLVNLPPKEHFICHLLLPKCYNKNSKEYKKLINALFAISILNTKYMHRKKLNSKKYEKIRKSLCWIRKGNKLPQSQKNNISKSLKGRIPWNKGLNINNSIIMKNIGEKVSKINKGKIVSLETRKKISNSRKNSDKVRGINNIWYGTHGPMYNKKHSIETRLKMSQNRKKEKNAFYGKKHTLEAKKSNSEKVKLKWKDPEYRNKILQSLKRKVICIETNIIYPSVNIASRMTKIKNISKCCKGLIESAGNLHWKYYNG